MVRIALQNAHTVGLRDKAVSYNILVDEIGIDPKTIRLIEVGDDTLDLTPEEPDWDAFDDSLRRFADRPVISLRYNGAALITRRCLTLLSGSFRWSMQYSISTNGLA